MSGPPAGPAAGPSRRALARDVAVQLVGRLANLALGIVVTLTVVRTLGDEGFGQWATVLAITTLAQNVGDLGLQQVAVRRAAAEPEREASWMGALLGLRTTIGVVAALGSALALALVSLDDDARLAGLLVAATLVVGAPQALDALFQLRVRNDLTTALITLNSVVWAAAVFWVAASDGGIVALGVGFLAASALTTIAFVPLVRRHGTVRLRGSLARWRELVEVGLPVGLAGIAIACYVRIDQVLVLELVGAREAGLYGAVYRILDQAQFIPTAVMTTLFPLVAAAWPSDPERVRSMTQRTAETLALASFPALALAIAAPGAIVRLLFGAEFADAAAALPVLLGAFVLVAFGHLIGHLVIVTAHQRLYLVAALTGLVVNVSLNLLLLPRYGFVAAAWVTLVTEVVVLGLTATAVLRRIGLRPRLGPFGRIAASAAVLAAVTALLVGAGVPVLLAAPAGTLAYLVALWATRALTPADVRWLLDRDGRS